MASTLTELLYHCIWSTKHRDPLISPGIENEVWKILSGAATRHGMHVLRAGGVDNHVHVLIQIPKTMSISEAMKQLKGGSSKHITDEDLLGSGKSFAWQDGYAAFTVSKSNVPGVVKYIAGQREHHRTRTFEEELVAFLDKHGIEYEPDYLWT